MMPIEIELLNGEKVSQEILLRQVSCLFLHQMSDLIIRLKLFSRLSRSSMLMTLIQRR